MGQAHARLEIPNNDGKSTSQVYVDKKGNIVDRPKWVNESRKNPYANRKSFIVPALPWLEGKGKKDART